jgi:CHASE2 domain-containing sensor protein
MTFLQKTGQGWKLTTFLVLVFVGGMFLLLMIWRVNDPTSLPSLPGQIVFSLTGTAIGIAAFLWLWWSVRCPRCRGRVAAEILRKESAAAWLNRLLEFSACPICGFRGGSSR